MNSKCLMMMMIMTMTKLTSTTIMLMIMLMTITSSKVEMITGHDGSETRTGEVLQCDAGGGNAINWWWWLKSIRRIVMQLTFDQRV